MKSYQTFLVTGPIATLWKPGSVGPLTTVGPPETQNSSPVGREAIWKLGCPVGRGWWRLKPQSVGELTNSQDQIALDEIWALAGAGANTKIAAATAVARNSFIGFPRVVRSRHTVRFPRLMACDTNPK